MTQQLRNGADVVDLFIENGPGHVDNKFFVFLEVGAVHKV